MLEIETPHGLARAFVHVAEHPRAALVLGHGAGGGVGSRDLTTVRDAALEQNLSVALVEQPYRVAGRRSPAPAHQLDTAWIATVEQLNRAELGGCPLVAGGRSSGARVACRTASATRAVGILCLAFPLRPPPRQGKPAGPSRLPELAALTIPTLVVQGVRDPFGVPPAGRLRDVVTVQSDHSLRSDLDALAAAVGAWLGRL